MSELKIVFLGTGSARPTPRRNVAGVFLQCGSDAIQFDCGEGSQMQILRAGLRTSRLRAICLTHFHGDHVNGLPGFIGTMGLNGHTDPLTLVGPRGTDTWLRALHDLSILRPAFPVDIVENTAGEVLRGDGYSIHATPLRHRLPTHGFLFKEDDHVGRFFPERARELGVTPGPDFGRLQRGESVTTAAGNVVAPTDVLGPTRLGRTVAYISDTQPSDGVVQFVKGVDVLIHEATYSDEFRDLARERGHSTARQAAEVAARAGVKRLIMTHISSKHVRAQELAREAQAIFPNASVAEDLAEVTVEVPE